MARRSNFLEADNERFEQNLRFVRNDLEDGLTKFFGGKNNEQRGTDAPPRDYKVVTPRAGCCVKTYKVNANEKYFINICQTEEIPAPEDVNEEELANILRSEDATSFRIPMSISEPRTTKDKSNNPVEVCDIAINPKFYSKIQKSILFKDFFMALIAEALSEKYNVQIKLDKTIILNNRKFIGTLVTHRVRNDDVKTVLSSYKNPTEADKSQLKLLENKGKSPLIQEIDANIQNLKTLKPAGAAKITSEMTEPEYKLRAKVHEEDVEELQAEFYLPKCISSQELVLDIGEDRILLESLKHGYRFDKFVNYSLHQERAKAIFDKTNKMLQVRIPVLFSVP